MGAPHLVLFRLINECGPHREASDAPMRYTVSKSREFEALRKRLEDTKLQLDRALAFICNQSEQLAAERYRDVLNMFNTLLLPDTISDKTEG